MCLCVCILILIHNCFAVDIWFVWPGFLPLAQGLLGDSTHQWPWGGISPSLQTKRGRVDSAWFKLWAGSIKFREWLLIPDLKSGAASQHRLPSVISGAMAPFNCSVSVNYSQCKHTHNHKSNHSAICSPHLARPPQQMHADARSQHDIHTGGAFANKCSWLVGMVPVPAFKGGGWILAWSLLRGAAEASRHLLLSASQPSPSAKAPAVHSRPGSITPTGNSSTHPERNNSKTWTHILVLIPLFFPLNLTRIYWWSAT